MTDTPRTPNLLVPRVAVRPRYLAGASSSADAAFAPLTTPHWYTGHDTESNCHAFADLHRLHVGFLPESREVADSGALWHIRARPAQFAPPAWCVVASEETPPEIVAAFTTTLATDLVPGEDRPGYLHRTDPPDMVWHPLTAAGWHVAGEGFAVHAVSPDRRAAVTYTPPTPGLNMARTRQDAWSIHVRLHPEDRAPLWWATLHSAIPAHLVAAFTTALADPRPLYREPGLLTAAQRTAMD